MISSFCACGKPLLAEPSVINQIARCEACGNEFSFVSAEQIPEGAGAADFDTRISLLDTSKAITRQWILGGVAEIEIGKLPERHISIPGTRVSRLHCKLQRIDFDPSRWRLIDNHSTNGVFVNGKRIATEHELAEGDAITIGEHELRYESCAPPVVVLPPDNDELAQVGTLGYAAYAFTPDAPIGECDPIWVNNLRQGVTFMLWSIVAGFFAGCITRGTGPIGAVASLAVNGLGFAGAWLISSRDPGSGGAQIIRLLLRIAACLNIGGQVFGTIGVLLDIPAIATVSLPLIMASVPQFFLFLWHLRTLALRIPDQGLATNVLWVMIGIPFLVLVLVGGFVYFRYRAEFPRAPMITAMAGLLGMGIWYIVLLVWFRRSIS